MTTVRRPRTISTAIFFAAAFLGISLTLTGCNDEPSSDDSAATTDDADNSQETDSGFGCGEKLTAALEMLKPERLGVSTDADLAESRLNIWLDGCGQSIESAPPIGPDINQLLESAFPQIQFKRIGTDRFISDDAEHLRNCQIHKELSKLDLGAAENDLERIVGLFHYCVRNIGRHSSPEDALSLTPFEILLFGRGSAHDVAWVYADLLRQLQIDTAIIQPKVANENEETDNPWLVGVLLDKKCYLFDTRLGTPIPGPADNGMTPTVMHVATLADVVADDGLLRKLDRSSEEPYTFTAEQLQAVTVQVIGTRSLWTSPMQRLQTALSGDHTAVVYDGLQDDGDIPGLLTRVAEAGDEHWSKEDIGVWPYPQQQLVLSQQRDERQRELLDKLKRPQDAPIPLQFDNVANQVRIGNPERRHLRSRIIHLMGDFDTAIRNYQTLRIRLVTTARQRIPDAIRAIHERAEDDAAYWIGLCQFDRGNYESAISTFRDYNRRYGKNPNAAWAVQSRMMLALSLAETGDWIDAVFELEESENLPKPFAGRHAFWNSRWKAAEKKKAEKQKAEKQESEKQESEKQESEKQESEKQESEK